MRLDKPRIPALHEDHWNEAQTEALGRQKMRGEIQNIFRTMAHHENLARRWLVFGNHILSKSTLPPRERELVILRIGWLCQAEYEWAQHVVIGRNTGLTDDEIEQIKTGEQADCWSAHDQLLLRATDELHSDAFITDDTWAGLTQTYNEQQMMDLVFTIGQYNMVSMALNSFGVQLDPDLKGF